MINLSRSLAILGCSQRKKETSRLLTAIERYDGPIFRVLRKHARDSPEKTPDTYILSARFGLISGEMLIPRYNRRLTQAEYSRLSSLVDEQLKLTLDRHQPEQLFVSVGSSYWPLLEEALAREINPEKLIVATGGIGGRASQLARWLKSGSQEKGESKQVRAPGEATLLGTTIRLNRSQVLCEARKALVAAPPAARRFETWYVAVGRQRVAPKWLVSILFDKPVASFRTADARRVLSLLGVSCTYVGPH
jgi:hypothetical protein